MNDIEFQNKIVEYLTRLRGVLPIGTPWWGFDIKSKPSGVQLYLGQILDRTIYPAHFSFIQDNRTILSETDWQAYIKSHNGCCPYYSYGNGETTYRMPRIIDVHPRFGNCIEEVGQYVEAGLPNITGHVRAYSSYNKNNASFVNNGVSGAFYWVSSWDNDTSKVFASSSNLAAGNADTVRNIPFDASRCSSVYGKSKTVQPPAINMVIGEYVVSGVGVFSLSSSETLQYNIDALDLKYSKSYVVDSYHSGSSWYKQYNDGFIEQGGNVTLAQSYETTLTFHKAFSSSNYQLFFGDTSPSAAGLNYGGSITRTPSYATCYMNSGEGLMFWYACGY